MSVKCVHKFFISGDLSGGSYGGLTVSVDKVWDKNAENPKLWLSLNPTSEFDGSIQILLTRGIADRIVDALNDACIDAAKDGDTSFCVYEESFR